jgi:hypothetical protein
VQSARDTRADAGPNEAITIVLVQCGRPNRKLNCRSRPGHRGFYQKPSELAPVNCRGGLASITLDAICHATERAPEQMALQTKRCTHTQRILPHQNKEYA